VVLGLLSVLVLMGWPLLVIPIAAVILALFALRQIRNSNGTQTGRGLAWTGIVLGVAFGALVGTREISARITAAEEQRRIEALVAQINERLINQQWQELYELFTPDFQNRWPPQQFHDRVIQVRTHARLGELQRITSGSRVIIEEYGSGKRGVGQLHFHYPSMNEPVSDTVEYRTVDGEWRVHHVPQVFASDATGEGG